MIVGFVGTPGSGKTYDAVRKIVHNLKRGRSVCTNIDGMDNPVCQEALKNVCGLDDYQFSKLFRFLSKDETMSFWEDRTVNAGTELEFKERICPPGSLIVIDEVHKYFSNREWNTDKNKGFAEWASTHRHEGSDVMLITQDIEKLDKHARSLLEWTYFYRKVNFLGSAVKRKYLKYSYVGDDHHGKPISTKVETYDSLIFACYKSYVTQDAKEVGFMTHVNVLKHPVFFILPVVLCYAIYSFSQSSFASGDLFAQKKTLQEKVKKHAGASSAAPVSSSAPVPVHAPVSSVRRSPLVFPVSSVPVAQWAEYRLDGYVKSDHKTVVTVNGRMFTLPCPDLKNVDLRSLSCQGLVSSLGYPKTNGGVAVAPATAPPPFVASSLVRSYP